MRVCDWCRGDEEVKVAAWNLLQFEDTPSEFADLCDSCRNALDLAIKSAEDLCRNGNAVGSGE